MGNKINSKLKTKDAMQLPWANGIKNETRVRLHRKIAGIA
jgi:hypothetical protein